LKDESREERQHDDGDTHQDVRTPMPVFRLSRINASSPPKQTGQAMVSILQFLISRSLISDSMSIGEC
jgi:hypothetical protein